jgi:hypothetical protein
MKGCSNCFRTESPAIKVRGSIVHWFASPKELPMSEPQIIKSIAPIFSPEIPSEEDAPKLKDCDIFCSYCFTSMVGDDPDLNGELANVDY